MRDPRFQRFSDGTQVRFTDEARAAMKPRQAGDRRFPRPLRTPAGGIDGVFTIDNTQDMHHDVILRENGERWGVFWLEHAPEPRPEIANVEPIVLHVVRDIPAPRRRAVDASWHSSAPAELEGGASL